MLDGEPSSVKWQSSPWNNPWTNHSFAPWIAEKLTWTQFLLPAHHFLAPIHPTTTFTILDKNLSFHTWFDLCLKPFALWQPPGSVLVLLHPEMGRVQHPCPQKHADRWIREILPKLGYHRASGSLLKLPATEWNKSPLWTKSSKTRGKRKWKLQISVNYILSVPGMPTGVMNSETPTATTNQYLTPYVPNSLQLWEWKDGEKTNKQAANKLFKRGKAFIIFLSFSWGFPNSFKTGRKRSPVS